MRCAPSGSVKTGNCASQHQRTSAGAADTGLPGSSRLCCDETRGVTTERRDSRTGLIYYSKSAATSRNATIFTIYTLFPPCRPPPHSSALLHLAGSTSAKTFTTLTCATRTRNEQFLILPSTDWSTTEEPRTDERHSLGLGVQLLTVWDVKALAQILVPCLSPHFNSRTMEFDVSCARSAINDHRRRRRSRQQPPRQQICSRRAHIQQ